jgi:hypothetical protein
MKDLDYDTLWQGMPEFIQKKKVDIVYNITVLEDDSNIKIRFRNNEDLEKFTQRVNNLSNKTFVVQNRSGLSFLAEQSISKKTKSIWYPYKSHWGGINKKYVSESSLEPRYPIYIVSKGRYKKNLTSISLDVMGIKHYIVCEEHEEELYKTHTNAEILVLPKKYFEEYETCDDLGLTKSTGPGAARNFCIDHSHQNGFERHWVMDDNIRQFWRLNRNKKYPVESGVVFRAAEDFVERFTNVPVSGLNYECFCKAVDPANPFTPNTRIYSCLLIDNTSGYRWRGRYNEDTDLSLRVLKDGLCTIQFNAFLAEKITTQRTKGGNTAEFYEKEGTMPKSKMLEDLHPDVSKVVWKFNRWHHEVNYKPFKNNELIYKENIDIKDGVDDYGMFLTDL